MLAVLLNNQIKTSEVHQLNEELTHRTLDRDTNKIMIKMIEQRGQIMQMGETIEEANEIIQSLVGRLQQMQEELNKAKGRES